MSQQQLSRLLPLPDEDLKQVLDYASTLSKTEAIDHFTNLLGDSPAVIDFISTFNSRRADPKAPPKPAASSSAARTPAASTPSSAQNSDVDRVPKPQRRPQKKKQAQLQAQPSRQVTNFALAPGTKAYNKKDADLEYISAKSSKAPTPSNEQAGGPSKPPPPQQSKPATQVAQPKPKPPPSAHGTLVSDLGKPKPKSNPVSRTSTPGPSSSGKNTTTTTKISIAGGTPMHGASTALTDLDDAIRQLEITTNPTHTSNSSSGIASRRCNCVAARHPLLAAAPNCLNCGKVICIREGLGPCTFCSHPLLSPSEIQQMIKELKAERGREKQAFDRALHKKADVGAVPKPFARPRGYGSEYEDAPTLQEAAAKQHAAQQSAKEKAIAQRDKLLTFQAENAQRTTVRDEAADFDIVLTGGSMWASPEERALALKKQQKLLREMEWNARPEYEKRQTVVSIDLVGKKVLRKVTKVERPVTPEQEEEEEEESKGPSEYHVAPQSQRTGGGGAFSKNPLLGGMIKPVYEPPATATAEAGRGKGQEKGDGEKLEGRRDRATRWRRVQDDRDDNEAVILDGGIYGRSSQEVAMDKMGAGGDDEPACG